MGFVYDEKMTYERAKKVLGLEWDSFTEKELKSAYHKMAKNITQIHMVLVIVKQLN